MKKKVIKTKTPPAPPKAQKPEEHICNYAIAYMESHETFTRDEISQYLQGLPQLVAYTPDFIDRVLTELIRLLTQIGMMGAAGDKYFKIEKKK